jgi:hypothetical protein
VVTGGGDDRDIDPPHLTVVRAPALTVIEGESG